METPTSNRDTVIAPVVPTASAHVRLRPVGLLESRITGGMWAARRTTNREVSIPHGAAQLDKVGNLFNFGWPRGRAPPTGVLR